MNVASRGPRRVPAALVVLASVAVAAGALLAVLATPGTPGGTGRAEVGERELVRVGGADGRSLVVPARVATGAATSTIDTGLARRLGLTAAGEPVTVRSGSGVEIRPTAVGTVQLGERTRSARLALVEPDPSAPPLVLGRSELGDVEVHPGRRYLAPPAAARPAPWPGAVAVAATPADGLRLLALVPVAALLVVLLRAVVGVRTLGVFLPVLLAIGYAQTGVVAGLLLTASTVAAGLLAEPLLHRIRVPRVARLAVLVGAVSVVLLAVADLTGPGTGAGWTTALPIVVTAVVVERLWEAWELDGPRPAATDAARTLAVALAATAVLHLPVLDAAARDRPLVLAAVAGAAAALVGCYRGVRLTDRRAARAADPGSPHPTSSIPSRPVARVIETQRSAGWRARIRSCGAAPAARSSSALSPVAGSVGPTRPR